MLAVKYIAADSVTKLMILLSSKLAPDTSDLISFASPNNIPKKPHGTAPISIAARAEGPVNPSIKTNATAING